MLWCCLTPERAKKSNMILSALAAGWHTGQVKIVSGPPPHKRGKFAVIGQDHLALDIVPDALASGRGFWTIDNGYWNPARGKAIGYYRVCYRGMTATFWPTAPRNRVQSINARIQPWRKVGRHILVALPSGHFGRAIGIDHTQWSETIAERIRAVTDRPIVFRVKDYKVPIERQLRDCWALVTHSSIAAIDAVLAGVPAFVQMSAPTAPLGNLDLNNIEKPQMADRSAWWASLMCQQFTLAEMRSGLAFDYIQELRRHVDGDDISTTSQVAA